MRAARLLLPLFVLSALVLGVPATAGAASGGGGQLEMYTATVDAATYQQLQTEGFDIVNPTPVGEGIEIDLVLSQAEKARLADLGVETVLWRNEEGLTASELFRAQEAGGFQVWRSWDEPGGIRDELYQVARTNKDIVDIEVIGRSVRGRPIVALRVTKGARKTKHGSKPAVLYNSTIHAREWISTEVNRRLLHWYIDQYRAGNKTVRRILKKTELWFVVVSNPDGYQYTFERDRLWRKNLRDNDGDGRITALDGVDLNRNFPEHWGYDDEGSSPLFTSQTYRGTGPSSEPETQAHVRLMERIGFVFNVTYHSFGQLLLYPQGWQVQTPTGDDPIYTALSGTDANPAIEGYDPDYGAELYITNGDQTDYAHGDAGTLAWTPELGEGNPAGGFVFPDDEAQVQREFEINLPFALDLARSAPRPQKPKSHLGYRTEPFHFDMTEMDPYKDEIPYADLTFTMSYGDPQPVQIFARRSLRKVRLNWRVNGGKIQRAKASEWAGGERWGGDYDVHYRYMRANVTGTKPGDTVQVWFTGKAGKKKGGTAKADGPRRKKRRTVRSDAFGYQAVEESDARVLILAAEDYTGATPAQDPGPHYLAYYTSALEDLGIDYDVYDVDARGREAPDHLGVLGHYDAVIWYMGDDFLTRDPGQPPGTGTARLANEEVLQVRAYLNEGGRLLYTGQEAGSQYASAFDYRPLGEPPYCDNVDQTVDDDCLALSDDFLQYYLGAYIYLSDAGTDPGGDPYPIQGDDPPYQGLGWTLNGPDSAQNQGHTASFITTSSILKPAQYPHFTSWAPAEWVTGVTGAYEPHSGSQYLYSDRADVTYKRVTRTLTVPAGGGDLSFWTSFDTEADWDYLFVEAHTVGQNNWTTLADENGATGTDTGLSCPSGWIEDLHPHLAHYQTHVAADPADPDDDTCTPTGTTGTWNAATGNSAGWHEWTSSLDAFAGQQVEVSISYVSDWATQGLGVWIDDISTTWGEGNTDLETGLGGWAVPGSPPGSEPNANDFERTGSVGYEEGAVVATDDTLYFGFGFEAITDRSMRAEVMRRAMGHLLP